MKFIKTVYAHCDVPCGIYEAHTMTHAAETCIRMIEKLEGLKDVHNDPTEHNNFVRTVMTKEQHAQKCKQELYTLWSDYFKPEHLSKYPSLHDMFWQAVKQCSKVKQSSSMSEAQELLKQVTTIADMFADSKN